jgi:hypothetical protein
VRVDSFDEIPESLAFGSASGTTGAPPRRAAKEGGTMKVGKQRTAPPAGQQKAAGKRRATKHDWSGFDQLV